MVNPQDREKTYSAYQSAGVDLQGIESLKERIGAFASLTHGPEVLKGVGAFAGLYRLRNYKNPVLAASTDGVGTKMKVASLLGHYESLGIDLVNLNVNDIVTCGAHPLLFLDYISLGKLDPQIVEPLLRGMVWACREVDCALVGGETAQMPGLYADGEFDLAGTVVGAVEESAIIDGSGVVEGDILLGLPSSGLHTNGFSLVRKVFDIDDNPSVLYQQYQDLGHSLGEELIKPHRCYYQTLKPHFGRLKAVVHVSGGGLPNNIPRLLPSDLATHIRLDAWEPQPIFNLIQSVGEIDPQEMYQVFNMGLGMVLICDHDAWASLQRSLPDAVVMGEVVKRTDTAQVYMQR